jgi:hypothetical protein
MALAGCGGLRLPGAGPAHPEAPVVADRTLRAVVVDLDRATRAHPRWAEVDALDRRIEGLVGQLSAVTASASAAPPPSIDLMPELRAAALQETTQLAPEFRRRMDAEVADAQSGAHRELDAYAAKIRADQQDQFDAKRIEFQAATQNAIDDKAASLRADSAQFQQETLEQYRLPLLNLRLKLDAVSPSDKKESDRVAQQLQALTKERDDKIALHDRANADALVAFQKQQQEAYVAQLQALRADLGKQGQQLVDQKAEELSQRLHTQLSAKQIELNAQLNEKMRADLQARQQSLVSNAQAQMAAAQSQSRQTLQVRVASLRAQISEAQAQRARLLAAIMAELRVEATELAQQRGWDLVLTRAVAFPDAPDVTAELIARIRK